MFLCCFRSPPRAVPDNDELRKGVAPASVALVTGGAGTLSAERLSSQSRASGGLLARPSRLLSQAASDRSGKLVPLCTPPALLADLSALELLALGTTSKIYRGEKRRSACPRLGDAQLPTCNVRAVPRR